MDARNLRVGRNGGMRKGGQTGFSLVEMLVAMVLGLVVTAGVITMFTSSQQSYQTIEGQGRIQENARNAITFINRSLRMAGYLGCVSTDTPIYHTMSDDVINGNRVNPPVDMPFESNLSQSIVGYEASDPDTPPVTYDPATDDEGEWIADLDDIPGVDADDVWPGTDVLVVRQASTVDAARLTAGLLNPNEPIDVFTEPNANDLNFVAGSMLLISDCEKASLFQVTGTNPAIAANDPDGMNVELQHNIVAGFDNLTTDLTGSGLVFETDAQVYHISTTVYFIAPSGGDNNVGDPVPALWVKTDDQAPIELVQGVSDLQILYGVDDPAPDTDRIPNRYLSMSDIAVADRNRIATVRVQVVTNSVNALGDEGVRSRTFESTVAVRNRVMCLDDCPEA